MSKPEQTPPKVFISYSHDSQEHADRVLALADRLIQGKIDVILDQYTPVPEEGWPLWMDRNIRDADFILMICTQTYYRRVMGEEQPGKGLGVRWEGNLIYNHIYNNKPQGSRFIPILFEGGEAAYIPTPVQGHTRYQIRSFDLADSGYEGLYRHLTGQHSTPRPDLGEREVLPPRPRGNPSTASHQQASSPPQPSHVGQPSVRDNLVRELTTLTDADLSLLVTSIEGASGNVSPNAPRPQRVSELIQWAESHNGPGLEALSQKFQHLFPR